MKERINYIDRMKGFAILLVVMGHVYLFSMGNSQCVMTHFISSFHMCLFMFLSGLVASNGITYPYWSYKKLGKKVIALIMPMLVFGILFSLTFNTISSFSGFIDRVIKFINAPEKAGYWYLMSLSVFYLSLQFFRLNKWDKWFIDIIISFATFTAFYFGWKYTAQVNDPFCLLDCGNNYFAFILGVFTTKYHLIEKLIKNNYIFSLSLIAFIILFRYICPIHPINSLIKHILIPLSAIIVIVTIFVKGANRDTFVDQALEHIGKNTLDIYVLHYFLVTNINLIIVDRWLGESDNLILSILIVLLVSIVIIYIAIGIGKILHQSRIINQVAYGRFE